MKPETYVETALAVSPASLRRVSWGAIFAGCFVTLVVQITLTLLGAAIGLSAIEPLRDQNASKEVALGSGIWLLVTGLLSIWVGACVAGRLAGGPGRADGLIHGIVTWSVSTCAMLFLLATTASAIIGGTTALLGGAMRLGGSISGGQGQTSSITDQLKTMFPQSGAMLPPTGRSEGPQPPGRLTELAQQDPELSAALASMEERGGASKAPAERDQVVSLLTNKHALQPTEASTLVEHWDQQFQQLRGQATQNLKPAGDAAARGISQSALWGFIALLLGMFMAAWGGWAGTASLPRYIEPVRPVT